MRFNVLHLIADDLRTSIGAYGHTDAAKTPHLDRLAAQGVVFENAYSQIAVSLAHRESGTERSMSRVGCHVTRLTLLLGLSAGVRKTRAHAAPIGWRAPQFVRTSQVPGTRPTTMPTSALSLLALATATALPASQPVTV